ncbi:MAG: helix-turn-helix domain-containing protein, partial [Patescibacteria group bacterium]
MNFFSKGSKKQKLTLFGGKKGNSVDWFTLPKLLTIKKVCELLEVHPNTLRNWDISGKLPAVRVGARKDRRYERDTIKRMYESLHPVAPLAHAPHTQLPAPSDGGKYVLKPGLSATKVKLLLISKKFTFFVYSTTIVAFTFVVVQMFFFAHVFVVQAEVAQVTPKILKLAPSSATGWENPNNAQQLDVISSGEINQFTPKNSATYVNRPVVVKGEETTVPSLAQMPTEEPSLIPPTNAPLTNSAPFTNTAATNTAAALSTTNPDLELGGFTVPGEISPDSVINDATLDISFGGQTYPDNEDVVTFSYSMDGGTSWQPLDSFAMTATVSNATHDGYWQYPLADKIASLQNLDSFRIKINYNAVPGPQEAAAYVDGVILNLTITEPPSESTVQQLDQSVTLDKQDFTAEEAPTLNVEVEKKSKLAFLGAKPTTREVKSLTITSPTGETTEVDAAGTATTEKNTTTAEYQIDLKELSAPGAYTITTTIEQNGYIREVTETFVWGALAMNTDKSLYQQGDTAHFSIGAVDDRGQTVCNADMDITITDPQGKKSILSTANGGVTVTDYCHQKELYQGPDYTGDFAINQTGAYTIDLRATVNGNVRTLSDAFTAENKPEFMLRRDGPTRVFPVVEQPMTLTVTVAQDFQGIIREFVPAEYTVRPENGGYEQPFDLGGTIARTIVWDVNLKAGSTVTLKYFFKAPDKSPALFFLGPARVGDWEELRAWQQAIDPAYMFLLATSSSAATGWTNQTTYDGASARFLRAAATYSGTGGAATHTPTVTGATVATTNDGLDTATCSLRCSSRASYGHTHTTTAPTAGAANNDPAYYSFYLWKSNAQNPTTIPQNTFMFSTTAQSGSWTQFSAANDRLVKLTNSHTTGGSDTHTHAMTSWGSLAASSGTILVGLVVLDTPPNLAGASHTHTAPGNSTSDSKTSLPPYVTTRIYQQTNATPQTIPQNMVGMFDADPGTGWDVVSDASPYLNNMVRGHATTAESTGGSATHNDTASTTSPANTTSDGSFAIGTDGAADDHTHTVTATITAGSDHTPPYVNFVLAKCTSASGCSGSSTYSVSGNVYSDEGSTLIGGTPTVRLLVNGSNTACGGGACTASVSSGSYTISNITTTSGDVLLLYLDTAGSPLATTVTVGSGANLTGINLYQNSLIVRHETGTSVTNANIATGIGSYSDTDILASVSTNNLTVANNTELHIWTGKTYDPNGTVTTQGTGDLHVDDSATAYLDTATSTINNNIAVDTGATLNVQATTTVNGAAAGGVTTAGTLNHTAGTFTIGNGTDEDLNVTAGTTTLSGGNTVIKDDINNCASGTLNINTGSNVDALSTTGIVNMGNGCSASAILNFNGGSLDVGQHMFLDAGTVNLNGGTHRAGVSADGIVEFARYANGGMTLNMTGGELVGRAIIVYNGETLTTTTVTGGTLTVDDLNGTVSAATWYQWSDDSPKFYNLQFNDTANAIDASSQLTYLNGSLTNNSAALTTNSKNITLEGNFTNNGSITIGTSTVILAGTSQQTVTGTTTFSTLTVTNNSGSDAQTSPSVIFADGYNYSVGTLNVTTGNAKLRFPQGPTYSFAVTGTLNLNSSDANKIYLRSNASGTQWRFNVSGSPVVYDVDVKDSNAIGSAIDATDATNVNSTNNTNWNFGGTISIGGTANGNDAATVMVAINGTPQAQTGTIGSGTWTISGVTPPSAGQTITVWVDNVTDANESTGITKWASGNVTGMVLNTNVVTIGSNQNQTLTVTEATQYTGASDEDVMHRLNSTTLATDLFSAYSTDQLSILASNGLTIGSTQILDTYDLNNAGTLTSTTTAAYYIRGSWTNSGTFTCGTSTVTFASQATGKTINTGGTGATKDFYNVTFEGTGGTWSPLTNTMVVTNDLNMNAGTLNNATGTANIQVNGNVQCGTGCGTITLGSGTFTMSTSGGVTRMLGTNAAVAIDWMFNNLTLTSTSGANTVRTNATGTGKIIVNGNLSLSNSGTSLTFDNETNDRILDITTLNIPTNTVFQASSTAAFTIGGNVNGGGGTFTPGTGTVTLDATTTNHWINFGSSLYNLVLNGSGGGWYNDQSNLTVTNDLTVTNGTLSSGGFNVTVGGHVQCGATCGTITLNSGTFTQSVSASKNFGTNVAVATNWTFYNLAFVNASGSNSITMNGTGTGQIIVSNNLSMTNSGTVLVVDDNTNDRIFDIANDVSIGAGVSFEASSSASFTVGGSWTNAGPFVHNSGTITFDAGTTGKTITDGGYNFGSITFNNAAGGWSFADSTTLSGDLTMTAGTLSGTNDITVNGGDAAGNGTINLTGGTFTLVGDGNFSGATGWTFYDLTFGLGGLCSGADYTTNAGGTGQVTITHTFDQGSCYCGETCSSVHYLSAAYGGVAKTWELSGTGTPVSYLILANNDTENSTFKYTGSGSVTVYSGTYHNLELAAPTAQTYAYSGGSIYGNLSINGNTTLNAGSGSVHMKGTGTIDANDESFYDFSVDGTSNTVTVQNTGLTISRAISTSLGGTLTIGSNLTVSHTGVIFAVYGTINGAGTLRFTNTSAGPGTGGTVNSIVRYDSTDGNIANTTFDARTYGGDVEVYSNSGSARTVTMGAGTHTISGNLSAITGSSQSGTFSLDNSSTNPSVTATGGLSITKGGAATPGIITGTGTWTFGNSVNLSNSTFTATAGHTLVMNSTGTLTSNSQALSNLTLSGTITLANATHTVARNLTLSGTVTAGTSTVSMTGQQYNLVGGGNTLYNLNINNGGYDIYLDTSDLTLSHTLSFSSLGELYLNSGRTLTMQSTASSTGTGYISGYSNSLLIYQPSTINVNIAFINVPVRFDATYNNITINDTRSFSDAVTLYNSSGSPRTIYLGDAGGQTLNFNSLTLTRTSGALTVDQITNDP